MVNTGIIGLHDLGLHGHMVTWSSNLETYNPLREQKARTSEIFVTSRKSKE